MLKRVTQAMALLVSSLLLATLPLPASALTINWINQNGSGFDATEQLVVNAAIDWWENLIINNQSATNSFDLMVSETLIDGPGGARGATSSFTTDGPGTFGIPVAASIQIDSGDDGSLFDDPTPYSKSEFLPGATSTHYVAAPGGGAEGLGDLLSIVKHEIGHALGWASGSYLLFDLFLTTQADGSRIFDAGGLNVGLTPGSVGTHANTSYGDAPMHPYDLMNTSVGDGQRRDPSTLDLQVLQMAFGYEINSGAFVVPLPEPSPNPVPLPFSVWLFGSGLMLLGACRRRPRLQRRPGPDQQPGESTGGRMLQRVDMGNQLGLTVR